MSTTLTTRICKCVTDLLDRIMESHPLAMPTSKIDSKYYTLAKIF